MAITLVGTPTTAESSSATNLDCSIPTGWQADDFAIATCTKDNDTGNWTATAGWTRLAQWPTTAGTDRHPAIFYRKLVGGDGTPNFAHNTSANEMSVMMHVFRGVDTSTPFDQTEQKTEGTNDTTPDQPDITTQTDDAWVVCVHFSTHDDISVAGPPPTAYTVRGNLVGSAMDNRIQIVATKEIASAGSQTIGSWTHTSSPTNQADWTCVTLALKPVGVSTVNLNAPVAIATFAGYTAGWTTGAVAEAIRDLIGGGIVPFKR